PFRLPLGAPIPCPPPWSRQRPSFVAGDWQGVPRRVLAKQRGCCRKCKGCGGHGFIGLAFTYRRLPGRLRCVNVYVAMLMNDSRGLLRTASALERRKLPLEDAQELQV